MQLSLFPVSVFLLPGGITNLRIFEPRYIRLVKIAAQNDTGFILSMRAGDTIYPYGTYVNIIDFETLPDGLLGITIEAKSRTRINHLFQEDDGLWVGDVSFLPDWDHSDEKAGELGEALKTLFNSYPEHAEKFGKNLNFEDLYWVCQRWLEILPLSHRQQQWFIAQSSLDDAKNFIDSLLLDSSKPTLYLDKY